jgi:hypothetical protein
MGMVKILGAFILVIALLLIFLKLLGRLSQGKRYSDGKGFRMRATLALDSRRYLAAVELDGRLLVMAVAGERVTPLAHWLLDDAKPEPASGFHPGTLGLDPEGDGPDDDDGLTGGPSPGGAEADGPEGFARPKFHAHLEKPVPRPGVKEPAFLRGETEEEEALREAIAGGADSGGGREGPSVGSSFGPVGGGPADGDGFSLGIDEEPYEGPQTDEELRYLDPAGPSAAADDPSGSDDPPVGPGPRGPFGPSGGSSG